MSEVIQPAVGFHYFPPGLRLPSQPQSITAPWPAPSYTAWWQMHIGVKNLCKVVTLLLPRVGFEPATCWFMFGRAICGTWPSSPLILAPSSPDQFPDLCWSIFKPVTVPGRFQRVAHLHMMRDWRLLSTSSQTVVVDCPPLATVRHSVRRRCRQVEVATRLLRAADWSSGWTWTHAALNHTTQN